MNVFGERARGWKKARKRGVSPIIATILLVAITVVLAAVLYVLVSGLTRTGANTPYSLGMTVLSGSATGAGNSWYDPVTISPTSGLTTSMFGLSVAAAGGATYSVAPAAGGSGCTPGTGTTSFVESGTGCAGPAAAGWFGVLVTSGGIIAASFLAGGWSYPTGPSTVPLSNSMTLYVISYNQLNGNDYTISAYSTGSSSVSGSGTL
jgi:flagellin-like protein